MSPSQTLGVVDLVRQSLLEGYGCDILHGTRDLGVAGVVAVARLAGVVDGVGEGVLDGEGGLLWDLLGGLGRCLRRDGSGREGMGKYRWSCRRRGPRGLWKACWVLV